MEFTNQSMGQMNTGVEPEQAEVMQMTAVQAAAGQTEAGNAETAAYGQNAPAQTEKKAESNNYTHVFDKPVKIMNRDYKAITFYFDNLTGEDVEAAELELQARNIIVLSAEVSSAFQSTIAARAGRIPADELRRLPLKDYMKIKNAARNFLVNVGY